MGLNAVLQCIYRSSRTGGFMARPYLDMCCGVAVLFSVSLVVLALDRVVRVCFREPDYIRSQLYRVQLLYVYVRFLLAIL